MDRTKQDLLVLTGNRRQFELYVKENIDCYANFIYVEGRETLLGRHGYLYATYGTWWTHQNAPELFELLVEGSKTRVSS